MPATRQELDERTEMEIDEQAIALTNATVMVDTEMDSPDTHTSAAMIKTRLLPPPSTNSISDFKENAIDVIDYQMPHDIHEIALDYLYAKDSKEDKDDAGNSSEKVQYPNVTFFSKNVCQLLSQAADAILDGGEKAVARVIPLIQNNPTLLRYTAQGKDRLGRVAHGTLIQIAAMAGDYNLRELASEEDNHGLVELLARAGKLSPEEVAQQISAVLFSEEAKAQNATRNMRVLSAFIKFAESIIARTDLPATCSTLERFIEIHTECQYVIDTFRKDLFNAIKPNPNDVITCGYIFDPHILFEAATWFEDKNNLIRLGGRSSPRSDLFWVVGIGSLQGVVSARDAQAFRTGITPVAERGFVPQRTLKYRWMSANHSCSSASLGCDFFLDCFGGPGQEGWSQKPCRGVAERASLGVGEWMGIFISNKDRVVTKIVNLQPSTCQETQPITTPKYR